MIKADRICKTESISQTTIHTNPPCGAVNKEFYNGENRGPTFYFLTLLFLLVKAKATNLILTLNSEPQHHKAIGGLANSLLKS